MSVKRFITHSIITKHNFSSATNAHINLTFRQDKVCIVFCAFPIHRKNFPHRLKIKFQAFQKHLKMKSIIETHFRMRNILNKPKKKNVFRNIVTQNETLSKILI